MREYHFKVSNNVINHLGLNLYNSLPAVLYELIANSYDAEANEVRIEIKKEVGFNNKVYVYDNGIGMNDQEFENRYLEVARDSRNGNNSERPKMGRKGLGKLSVYAISDTVCIFSKKSYSDTIIGLEINYKEASKVVNPDIYKPKVFGNEEIPNYIKDWFMKYNRGTITVINSCRRNFNKLTLDKISSEIEKNFYLILGNPSDYFNVTTLINNFEYQTKKSEPKFNCDFIFNFDNTKQKGNVETLSMEEDFKLKITEQWKNENKNYSDLNLFSSTVYNQKTQKEEEIEIEIKGWIGTLDSIKDIDKTITGVPLIVRNRIVKDNVIGEYSIERFWTKYFVGELILDYMDKTDIQDIISPNRQGFDSNVDDRYDKTKYIIEQIVKSLIRKKDNRETKEKQEKKKKVENYRDIFSNKIQKLEVNNNLKKDIISNYVETTGLKVINEDYIIFISHCSKNRCIKSYEMSNYLFSIISEITKNKNNIRIERIVYTSDKKHDGHVKAGEDIYDWMKNHALNEKFPNSIFISCISEEFLKNWNTIIEFGSAWVADKKNYSFIHDRKRLSNFAINSGIGKPLNLSSQNFDFNEESDDLFVFLSDIFNGLITQADILTVINNKVKWNNELECINCLNLHNQNDSMSIIYQSMTVND